MTSTVPIGDPRPAGEEGPAGDTRAAGEEGVAGDPRPAGQQSVTETKAEQTAADSNTGDNADSEAKPAKKPTRKSS